MDAIDEKRISPARLLIVGQPLSRPASSRTVYLAIPLARRRRGSSRGLLTARRSILSAPWCAAQASLRTGRDITSAPIRLATWHSSPFWRFRGSDKCPFESRSGLSAEERHAARTSRTETSSGNVPSHRFLGTKRRGRRERSRVCRSAQMGLHLHRVRNVQCEAACAEQHRHEQGSHDAEVPGLVAKEILGLSKSGGRGCKGLDGHDRVPVSEPCLPGTS